MNVEDILKRYKLEYYVKNIFVLENNDNIKKTLLPFFADGYPGLMFQQASNGIFLHPKNKKLSDLFLYGQTLDPIELSVEGSYKIVVFQLYPYAAKALLGVNPRELNDDCYDLNLLGYINTEDTVRQILNISDTTHQVEIIAEFISGLTKVLPDEIEVKISLAINLILASKGKISIKILREKLNVSERTLQRYFKDYIGISSKQFSKIVQFHTSLNQISEETFTRLTDIVYENGYADQSHFIRNFKKYTGQKPSAFKPPK